MPASTLIIGLPEAHTVRFMKRKEGISVMGQNSLPRRGNVSHVASSCHIDQWKDSLLDHVWNVVSFFDELSTYATNVNESW